MSEPPPPSHPPVKRQKTSHSQRGSTPETPQSPSTSDSQVDDIGFQENRYFTSISTGGTVVCFNCKQQGHTARKCPFVICSTCGAVDSHTTPRCPTVIKCRNCGKLGHLQYACREPIRRSGFNCTRCNSTSHDADSCPRIWRIYKPVAKPRRDFTLTIFCYNCASSTHYGDNCPFPLRYRRDGVSAFNLANAPISREEESRLKKADRIAVAKKREMQRIEEQDDWFSRRERDKKRGFSSRNEPSKATSTFREGILQFRRGRNNSGRPGRSR